MSRLDPPKVLLDRSFLTALTTHDDPNRERARTTYQRLLDEYEAEQVLLVALSTDIVDRGLLRTLLAPVDVLHVAGQHRRAASRASADLPADLAVAAVLCHRDRIHRIATFDPRWAAFDVDLEPTPLPPHSGHGEHTDAAAGIADHCSPA